MDQCLVSICERFEEITDFLEHKSQEQEDIVIQLFSDFVECFTSVGAEKLEYPKEFQKDVKYFLQGEPVMMKQFEDIEFRFLMLSDFYDFCRLTKKYTNKKEYKC
ncbi:hypothetical protein [Sulfuricurvum sp.]|uniref:hypothetical protein n=1 Tax=Sulfuricurvum sp. TaxID=2025608 RepID=UPI00261EE7C5|nr:hypothetical protein [Sulfuricurvum sp.]MDD2780034.1 hypothetical protein [Sulfuricurvum sp.]